MAAAWCAVTGTLLYGFDAFPALHGDEAWIGIFARRLLHAGNISFHGMNDYTGVLFGWLVSKLILLRGDSFFTLRLLGVACNALAALVGLRAMTRHFGPESGWAWLYLLGSSAMFLLQGRVAWEVCALQPLIMTLLLTLCLRFSERGAPGFAGASAFLSLLLAGIHNHFIFLSVPASLLLMSGYMLVRMKDWRWLGFFRLAAAGLGLGAMVFLVHPAVTEPRWQRGPGLYLAFFLCLPAVFAALYRWAPWPSESRLKAMAGSGGAGHPKAARMLRWGLTLPLAGFLFYHLLPLYQIQAGPVLFKRLASWEPPLWASLLLHLWAAALIAAVLGRVRHALHPRGYLESSPQERLVYLWPAAFAVVFIIFRHTSSIRYYILPWFLLLSAAAAALPRVPWIRSRGALILLACAGLTAQGLIWRVSVSPPAQVPLRFKLGWRHEKSYDFFRKEALQRVMDDEKICIFVNNSSFIDLPLFYYRAGRPLACDRTKRLWTAYCLDCPAPPFFKWEVRRAD